MSDKNWSALVEDMVEMADVSAGKMFGKLGLRTGKKFFAILWEDGRLVVKLPKPRVAQVVAGGGEPFMPMPDRVMGDWVIAGKKDDWFTLANESKDYVEALLKG